MKPRTQTLLTKVLLLSACFYSVPNAFADDLEITEKQKEMDEMLFGLENSILSQIGMVQPDKRAIELEARNWNFLVSTDKLEGATEAELDASWEKKIADLDKEALVNISGSWPDEVSEDEERLTKAVVKAINEDTDANVEVRRVADSKKTKKWFESEIMTRAARQESAKESPKHLEYPLQFYHIHQDDSAAELIGKDWVLIRGYQRVIEFRFNYDAA